MSKQLSLFEQHTAREQMEIALNPTVEPHDVPRLSAQHRAILARLKEGPATNLQLSLIAMRFGARLEELKRAGHPWTKRLVKPGVYEYRLI